MTQTIALPLAVAHATGASVFITGTGGQGVSGDVSRSSFLIWGKRIAFSSAPGGAYPVTGHAQIPRTDARL